MIVAGDVDWFEEEFLLQFPNSSAHPPDTILGMEFTQRGNSIGLNQTNLIQKVLEELNLSDCQTVSTPMTPGIQLVPASSEEQNEFSKTGVNYRTYTGLLNYLLGRTRPDISAAASILSQFNQNLGMSHWMEVLHVWKYLAGSLSLSLTLQPRVTNDDEGLSVYTDSTWANDPHSRKSQTGYIIFWKKAPVAWKSQKQSNITLSSTKAELNALVDGAQESLWIQSVVSDLWKKQTIRPSNFIVDNKGFVDKLKHFGSNSKTKYIDMKLKWLRDELANNRIRVTLTDTSNMIADSLTKASTKQALQLLTSGCFQ